MTLKKIFALCVFISMLPTVAIAETAAQEGDAGTFQAPAITASSPTPTPTPVAKLGSLDLTVYVVNEDNGRFLGDVKLTFSRYPKSAQIVPDTIVQKPYKTTDPPSSSGYKIENASTREYELVAERKGYKTYDDVIDLTSDKKTKEITIKMTPLAGTLEVDESETTSYIENIRNAFSSVLPITSNQLPYSTSSAYNTTNNGTIFNPTANYPYTSNQQYYNGTGQYAGQNTYNMYANAGYTVPLLINLTQTSLYNSETMTVNVYDLSAANTTYSQYNTLSNQISLTRSSSGTNLTNQTQSLYGCLQPGRSYTLSIKKGTSSQAITKTFTTPSDGQGVLFNIAPLSTSNVQINVSATTNGAIPYQCPNTNYQNTYNNGDNNGFSGNSNNGAGNYVFADQQVNFTDLSNYTIQRMPQNGWYYLVNKSNSLDNRQLYFVDRGDSKGGLVFFSSTQTATGQDPPSSSQWYFTGYSRSDNDNISFTPEVFTKTSMSPSAYAKIVNKTVIKYFENSAATN